MYSKFSDLQCCKNLCSVRGTVIFAKGNCIFACSLTMGKCKLDGTERYKSHSKNVPVKFTKARKIVSVV